jgi:hypothetical protein
MPWSTTGLRLDGFAVTTARRAHSMPSQTKSADEWPECCLTCRLQFPTEALADAHWKMTGHAMGWPLGDDYEAWPMATEDRWRY